MYQVDINAILGLLASGDTWCGVIRWVLGFSVRAKKERGWIFTAEFLFVTPSWRAAKGETAVTIIITTTLINTIVIINHHHRHHHHHHIIIELKQQRRGQQWMVNEILLGFYQTLSSLFSDTKFAKWSIIFIFLEYSSKKLVFVCFNFKLAIFTL